MSFVPASDETPSETGSVSSWSPDKKVSDWLKRFPASSSGYETMSEVQTQADADEMMSVRQMFHRWNFSSKILVSLCVSADVQVGFSVLTC